MAKGISLASRFEPWWTLLLVPIWQEVVFRFLPYRIWYQPTGRFWLVGLMSSIAFALIHWYFGKWFTLYAFAGGIILWWLMTSYGLWAAIGAHVVINTLDLYIGIRKLLAG